MPGVYATGFKPAQQQCLGCRRGSYMAGNQFEVAGDDPPALNL